MDYNLAKKLKEAGFPQECREGDFYFQSDNDGSMLVDSKLVDFTFNSGDKRTVRIPTSDELIEEIIFNINYLECSFCLLDTSYITDIEIVNSFRAEATVNPDEYISEGSSPLEALANLYIKIHEKNEK